jgi:hypothetical protein
MGKKTRQQRRRGEREARRGGGPAQTSPGEPGQVEERALYLPGEASWWVDAFDLESQEQAREFHNLLRRQYGNGPLTEEQLSDCLASYQVALTIFEFRHVGLMAFEVKDPLDMAEARALYMPPAPEFGERLATATLPKGLTLEDMEALYRLKMAGGGPGEQERP